MDAIMLQEKLVEKLLCARSRTTRQKVVCVCLANIIIYSTSQRVGHPYSFLDFSLF